MEQNKIKNIVTIGNGIAAWCLHFYLKDTGVKITNISADEFFKPCSKSSTAINCLRGTTKGNSPLGDCIIDAMVEFERFYKKHMPRGVSLGHEYQVLEQETIPKWERRYPDFFNISEHTFLNEHIKKKNLYHPVEAYFFDINTFESWIKESSSELTSIQDVVIKIKKEDSAYKVKTRNDEITADAVFLCTNHLTHLLSENINDEFQYYLDHSKPVAGGYLELAAARERGFSYEESFVLAIEKYHFIYRKEEDLIQIGSSSKNKSAQELPLKSELEKIYDFINTYTNFDLPQFDIFSFKGGVRHKGYLRRPYWGAIDGANLYACCGLYKNAWSFSFLAAKELSAKVSSQEHLL